MTLGPCEVETDAESAVVEAFRQEWGCVVAALIGLTGDWDLAEECAQDAFAKAAKRWPRDGVPRRPGAWLTTVARNRAMDMLRRASREAVWLHEAATLLSGGDGPGGRGGDGFDGREPDFADDRLRLIFTCCHPALSMEARVALTLRTLTGMSTAQIARAFMTSEPTMAKRLVRAKHKIGEAKIPYRVPPAHLLPERLGGVLAVIYLLFNEGYSAGAGTNPARRSLCTQALDLARALGELMPEQPEALGLLALVCFQDARLDARLDAARDLMRLEDQDRSRWDRRLIDEGAGVLATALRLGRAGPYQVQAAIAACHATAASAADTDWLRIAHLYQRLGQMTPSPVVALNRAVAVAVAMADGPAVALAQVEELAAAGALSGYYPAARHPQRPADTPGAPRRGRRLLPYRPAPGRIGRRHRCRTTLSLSSARRDRRVRVTTIDAHHGGRTMKYMLIHYIDEALLNAWDDGEADLSPEDDRDLTAWDEEMDSRGILIGGGRLTLPRASTTLRVRDGELLITDGPFAETREQIAGYSVLECEDLDQAIEIASRHPTARFGAFELRPYISVSM